MKKYKLSKFCYYKSIRSKLNFTKLYFDESNSISGGYMLIIHIFYLVIEFQINYKRN